MAGLLALATGSGIPGPEPPRRLRERVLAIAGGSQRKRFAWFPALVAATGTAVLVAGISFLVIRDRESTSRIELAELRSELRQRGAEAAAMREAMTLIQAPETREVRFGDGQPAPPHGRVFAHPGGVLLIASNLPQLPTGKTWEMWLIRDGKPAPAGVFTSDGQGNAFHLFRPMFAPATRDVVAVTLEAAGGAQQPTGTPVLAASL